MDLDGAKSIKNTYKKVFDTFPELKGKLGYIDSQILSRRTYAQCYSQLGIVDVNKLWYNMTEQLAKSYDEDVKNGWHPKGTDWHAVVMHEIGHGINGYIGGADYAKYATEIRRAVMKNVGLKNTNENVIAGLSEYAKENPREFFAEAFAEYMCSSSPRPIAKAFGELLKSLLK